MLRPAPGQVWSDRFQLIREIGRGASGRVWLAEDRSVGSRVAIKILDPALAGSPDAVALLQEECRKAGVLRHPNIVRVDGFFAVDDGCFIAMAYVDGRPLTQWRDRSVASVIDCALGLCDALEHAHLSGIIHRDLKPANVLRDDDGRFYLTDFGIAGTIAPTITGAGATIDPRGGGSLPYMSPQQLAGDPASVADDVYGFGALLYELLSGAPPFHPAPTAQRVRTERPPPLTVDPANQAIPSSLSALVLAMLNKEPGRRPAGIAAVRSALKEIHTAAPGAETIRPQRRAAPGESVAAPATPVPLLPDRRGFSPTVVFAALAALVAVAAGVVFWLPTFVAERGAPVAEPPVARVPEPAADPGTDVDPATLAAQRQRADEALGEVLAIDERLRAIGVDLWGGDDWASARAFMAAGDNAYREREFVTALREHRRALELLRLLDARAPEVFARALADGEQALLARDQPAAIGQFEIALAIEPLRPEAQRGLERALRLDRVLDIMGRAIAAERAGEWSAARAFFDEAIALDPDWQPAADGVARMRAELARLDYETQMAAGFDALQREAFAPARRAFEAALAMRPGDPAAQEALRQVDADARLRKIEALRASARAAEAGERWTAAVQHYVEVLATDPKIDAVRADLARARAQARLDADLNGAIAVADRFYEDSVATQAAAVLAEARAIESPGPALTDKVQRLDTLLRVAARPVPVRFRSDNLTDVVIYKVGRLGTFEARTLDLRPGAYVAVGTRDGYRDVRRSFRVIADGSMPPVVLRCEDPI